MLPIDVFKHTLYEHTKARQGVGGVVVFVLALFTERLNIGYKLRALRPWDLDEFKVIKNKRALHYYPRNFILCIPYL